MTLSPGTRLGPYEIEDAAGAGGMGEVYRARDTRLDRQVAIKVLPAHLSENPELRQRFLREAKTVSSLQHPNICALHDVGEDGGTDYLVMEYLEGETLSSRLESGPIPPAEMLKYAVQITEALDVAHQSGVVHRDLKPGNVILTRAGAKLLDFGLARITTGGVESSSSFTQLQTESRDEPLTERGTILGTIPYMSPEQLEGAEADARSDIFALGAVLYEMATGRRAFPGTSQASVIASIMNAEPESMTNAQPMTPPALERLVRICLEKDRRNRWQTAHDLALQLRWIRDGGSDAGIPRPVAARRRGRERLAWIVAGIAVAAAAAFLVAWLRAPAPAPSRSVRFTIEAPPEIVSLGSPRVSPDGHYIAFNAQDESDPTTRMWVRRLDAEEAYPLPGTDGCRRPFWSPDSRHIGFFTDGRLKRVAVDGGPPMTLASVDGWDGSWGLDYILFDTNGDSILAVPVRGGTPQVATQRDRSKNESAHGWPHFLPDGERFLFVARVGGTSEIRMGRIGSSESTVITSGSSRVEYVHPGFVIYELDGTLLAQPFDAERGEVTDDAFPLADGIGVGDTGLAHFSGSGNGTLIYTKGDDDRRRLVWMDRNGRELGDVGEPDTYDDPALSPDGKRLAVQIGYDIWIVDLEREVRSRLTLEGRSSDPVWFPNSSTVLFSARHPDGSSDLCTMNASGRGGVRTVVERPYRLAAGLWIANGELTVGAFGPERGWDILTFSPDESDSLHVLLASTYNEVQDCLSPDGRYLAYATNETGDYVVYVMSLTPSGGKWVISGEGGTEPMWRGDGRELFYLAPDRTMMAVDVTLGETPHFGTPRPLFRAPVTPDRRTRNRYVVTPDGERFLVVALPEGERVDPIHVILNWTAELADR